MKVKIKDNIFQCKVAVSHDAIENGMMGKNFNTNFNGMLFMMPNRGEQSFWMYNCIVPLDIIMMDNNRITKIHHNCHPCYNVNGCENYNGFGDMVLEVAGDTCRDLGINEGDEVSFSSL
jgi:uncharacterized membrane protein (UPF0127 family)